VGRIAAFCNEGVVVMALNVQSEMANPRSFPSAVTVALSFFALCYLAVGVAGFALYRDKVASATRTLSLSLALTIKRVSSSGA
jgi:hypothetical protein